MALKMPIQNARFGDALPELPPFISPLCTLWVRAPGGMGRPLRRVDVPSRNFAHIRNEAAAESARKIYRLGFLGAPHGVLYFQ